MVDLGADYNVASLQAWYRVDEIYGSQFAYRLNNATIELQRGSDRAVGTVQLPADLSSRPRPYVVAPTPV